ncbi:MAG TPA: extracellular solute-binding protein [Anaerolineae bacterium]|nr:extracellular solute-binding protein [Anaerolineae bacterium]
MVEKTVEVPAAPKEITIEYWQYFYDARVDAMNRLIQQFEAENPDIHVIHTNFPYADYRDKVAASVPAGVGPDVITLYYGWLPQWVDAGYLVPLPEDEFPPEMIENEFSPLVKAGKFMGKYWAIPTAVRTLALFWNKDLFAEAGLDPEKPPQTLDEFVDYAKKLTKLDANGNYEVMGYAVEMPGQAHHWFREVLTRQFGQVPQSEDHRKILWNASEAGYQAWEWLCAFETTHKTGTNDLFDGATQAFYQGKEALHIDGSFRLGSIAKNAPDLNFGVAPLPVGPTGEKATFGSFWTHGLTKKAASDPRRMAAAIKFLKFITSSDAMRLWVKKVGELPARLDVASDPELLADPKLGPFAEQLPYAHATFFVNEINDRQALIDAFDAVRLQGEDPRAALDEAVAKVQAEFDEFWARH